MKDDPANDNPYNPESPPKIYGWHNKQYVYELTWASDALTASNIVPIPAKMAIPDAMSTTLKPEWISFGRKRFAIFSPINCLTFADTKI